MESGFYPGGRRTTGSHSILIFFSVERWKPASSSHMHIYPFTLIVSFSFSFPFSLLVHIGKNELEGPEGDGSLGNLCSHGGLLGEGAGEERRGLAELVRLATWLKGPPRSRAALGRATLPAFDLCSCTNLPPTEVVLSLPPFCAVRDSRLALGACFPGRARLRAHPGVGKCPRRRSQAPPPGPAVQEQARSGRAGAHLGATCGLPGSLSPPRRLAGADGGRRCPLAAAAAGAS